MPVHPQTILTLPVPVIATLARRRVRVDQLLGLQPGSILDLRTPADRPVQLSAGNRPLGEGVAVKVGDRMGVHITRPDAVG
jgi:flagellar motor switch/type III secretory pathway protein FliN